MHRFTFTARRLGASLAAGGAAAALVASEQNRQPRCSAVEVRVSELEARLEQAAKLEAWAADAPAAKKQKKK